MKIPAKYKKWLTKRAWYNCLRLTVALFVIAWLFESANMMVFSDVNPIWLKSLFLIGMTFLFSIVIWLLALLSPELFELVFDMLGFKDKDEKNNED